MLLIGLGALVLSGGLMSCTGGGPVERQQETATSDTTTTSTMTIQEALDKHTRDLMALDGVQGTAQGRCDEQPCITVYVLEKTPELRQAVPDTLEGYPVSLVKTERFEAQPPQQSDSSSESRGEES
jgi:hypothetical protein